MTQDPPDPETATLSEQELQILYQTSEAVDRVDAKVDRALEKTDENTNDIQEVKGKVRRNTTVLGVITGGFSVVASSLVDKLPKIL